ncbi:MAG: aminotransferase class V-fold PLP-dependent enzyme [Victivallaceae bacterium]|nr:aminotransferase class V-fold PLP-dependent enzyme [Victivallaceae bacterium]
MNEELHTLYFDSAAAAPVPRDVAGRYAELVSEFGGINSESAHAGGRRLRKAMEEAEKDVLSVCAPRGGRRVIFASSFVDLVTFIAESRLVSGRKVVTTAMEHPSVLANLRRTASGLELLASDAQGRPKPVESDAGFCSFTQVQSEIGTVLDFTRLRSAFPDAVIVSDSVQAAGKMPIPEEADIVLVSGAKFGAPGGGAAMLVGESRDVSFIPAAYAKWRSSAYRIDRADVPGTLAMAYALRRHAEDAASAADRIVEINAYLRKKAEEIGLRPTVPPEMSSPYILHLVIPGKQGAVVARILDTDGVMCSSGSACKAETDEPSPALRAIGYRGQDAYSGLRISLSPYSTMNEAKRLADSLKRAIAGY